MKPSVPLEIYIASSFRNLHAVQMLAVSLREAGHTILDWTRLAPPIRNNMPMPERKALLDSDERGEIFDFCRAACGSADLVIYIDPAGQDAACEVGMAAASGILVFGLSSPLDAPGLILSRAVSQWFTSVGALLAAVEVLAEETAAMLEGEVE